MRIGEEQARALVRARLGREPADFLESAVVLEAWGGLRAPAALDVAPTWQPDPTSPAERVTRRDHPEQPRHSGWVVVSSVLGTALYLLVLHRHLGASLVDDAWRSVLPFALAWQWAVRRRYVGGTRHLAGDRHLLAVVALVALLAVAALGSPSTLLAALILLPWSAAALVAGTPLAPRYATALGAGAAVTLFVPVAVLAVVVPSLVAVFVALHALRHESGEPSPGPAPWRTALPAVVPGFALGLLILAAPVAHGSISGLATIAALLPSLFGNHAAGAWLRRLWEMDASPRSVVLQALGISVVMTSLGSVALLAVVHLTGDADLRSLAVTLAFLLLVAMLTFPLILLDAFRFDAALVSIGAVTLVVVTIGSGPTAALLATAVAVAVSALLVGQLLGDGNRLRSMPG